VVVVVVVVVGSWYCAGTSLLDELEVEIVVVVVGPWYCTGISLLDELDITELELEDWATLLLLEVSYMGGSTKDEVELLSELLDCPG
jgi:hypothetical protein